MSHQQVKSLRKSNEDLKRMLDSARRDIKSLEERVGAQELVVREEANGGREAQLETERSLEWLHDPDSSFQSELHGIRKRLDDIEENLGKLEIAVNEIQDYSYAFNIKILGVPELKANEDASETSNLCVNLFNHMGANITINDIDIAHRVPFRDPSRSDPKPIICKCVRRLARNNVMAARRHASSVAARDVGLEESQDMSKILILDHLTPRMQELYGNAKSFKTRFGFQFCWVKNGTIFLRRSEDSRSLKVRCPDDLSRIIQDEQEALS
ncbi:unnamed protein product [Pocillopora meandrina]|uniref:FP protein C-terminal domain-containing protein n=1 Tax=Pocillopora meandrina TaxID=46732 RepID=A0AAU9XFA7_9CNID|nr:unnamed protein product [Pocillopora meandrina]